MPPNPNPLIARVPRSIGKVGETAEPIPPMTVIATAISVIGLRP